VFDVAGAVADVAPDAVAEGSLALVAPAVDGRDGDTEVGGELTDAEELITTSAWLLAAGGDHGGILS
jgi:hypothetical protein